MDPVRIHLETIRLYIKSKLEALSAGVTYFLLFGLIPTGIFVTAYVLFCTRYWYVAALYLFWICVIDANTPHGKGRMNSWVQNWTLFRYTTNYFPINADSVPGMEVDPKRNYMACCFPHGIMPTGAIMAFQTNALNVRTRVAHHKTYGVALNGLFYIPIYRDFLLSIGLCNSNSKTIENILTSPEGGKILGIIIGGSAEMFYCQSGVYRVVLKNRKGFIKIALRTGSPLIPVFSFGETSIYKQKVFRKGSFARRLQEWSKVIFGFPVVLFYGCGLFQNNFGMIPLKSPINVVVGKPIDVKKIENPSQADIDTLHAKFVDSLKALFEKHKYKYEPNPERSQLIIC